MGPHGGAVGSGRARQAVGQRPLPGELIVRSSRAGGGRTGARRAVGSSRARGSHSHPHCAVAPDEARGADGEPHGGAVRPRRARGAVGGVGLRVGSGAARRAVQDQHARPVVVGPLTDISPAALAHGHVACHRVHARPVHGGAVAADRGIELAVLPCSRRRAAAGAHAGAPAPAPVRPVVARAVVDGARACRGRRAGRTGRARRRPCGRVRVAWADDHRGVVQAGVPSGAGGTIGNYLACKVCGVVPGHTSNPTVCHRTGVGPGVGVAGAQERGSSSAVIARQANRAGLRRQLQPEVVNEEGLVRGDAVVPLQLDGDLGHIRREHTGEEGPASTDIGVVHDVLPRGLGGHGARLPGHREAACFLASLTLPSGVLDPHGVRLPNPNGDRGQKAIPSHRLALTLKHRVHPLTRIPRSVRNPPRTIHNVVVESALAGGIGIEHVPLVQPPASKGQLGRPGARDWDTVGVDDVPAGLPVLAL